jgi:serine/threonine protein kinase/outer membrane protein assembly factor BamD (BamD/ComL family)
MIGEILGNRYKIIREIGSGGMAWVYLAEDLSEGTQVAAKVLYPQFSEDISYIQRFNREAKLAISLNELHIVRVLDYGATRDIHYLIMEHIEGRDLLEILEEKGPLSYEEVLNIAFQVAKALEHASQHGIVHRDIKPQNLMVTADGTVKVCDFGIARAVALPSLTQSGFVGSPYYISPEQAMGENVDVRSDIYSLGIVMYQMLSGKLPFDAKSPWSIISQHIASKPPSLRLNNTDLPEAVEHLVNRAMAKRPEDRFQTPVELIQAVEDVFSGKEVTAVKPPVPERDIAGLVEDLYRRALEASQAEEWQRAVNLFNQVINLRPDYEDATERLAEAGRQARLSALYSAANRALEAKRWQEAIDELSEIVAIDAHYKDASKLLTNAGLALSESKAAKKLKALYQQGLEHFDDREWPQAVDRFAQVHEVDPNYEEVAELLAEARRRSHGIREADEELARREPLSFGTRLAIAVKRVVLTIVFLVLVGLGFAGAYVLYQTYQQPMDPLADDYQQALTYMEQGQWDQAVGLLDEILAAVPDYKDAAEKKAEALEKQELTRLYDQGQAYFEQGEWDQAVNMFDKVLAISPDYKDVVEKKAEALEKQELTRLYEQGQAYFEQSKWDEAIAQWQELRARDPGFNEALVEDMLCRAYLEKGLLDVAAFDEDGDLRHLHEAMVDFGQGLAICPDKADLQEEKTLASLYLDVNVAYGAGDWNEAVTKLNVIRELRADYDRVTEKLYAAYVNRGDAYAEEKRWELALADYELALELEVSDKSMAVDKRDDLLEEMANLSIIPTPTQEVLTPRPTATPTKIATKYSAPKLVRPANRMTFATMFEVPTLEWKPVGELASDEYYSVLVVHYYPAGNPVYWTSGLIKETQVKLPEGAGYGKADHDEFYWWVTVHRATKTTPDGKPDGPPISPESEVRMFFWGP